MAKKKVKASKGVAKKQRKIVSTLRLTADERNLLSYAVDSFATDMKRCSIDESYSASDRKVFRFSWVSSLEILKQLEGK